MQLCAPRCDEDGILHRGGQHLKMALLENLLYYGILRGQVFHELYSDQRHSRKLIPYGSFLRVGEGGKRFSCKWVPCENFLRSGEDGMGSLWLLDLGSFPGEVGLGLVEWDCLVSAL